MEKKKITLNDVCELIVDCEHKTAPTEEVGYPSIRTPNIGRGFLKLNNVNRVSEATYIKWTKRAIPKENDLIIAREAPVGNVAIIPSNLKVCLGQRTVLVRPNPKDIIPKYLNFLLSSEGMRRFMINIANGSTVAHLNMSDIRSLVLPKLPPLPTQKKIANILSAYDDLIENNEKRIAILEQMAQNLYKEWFVRFRFPGHEEVAFVDGLPKGWKKGKLKDILTLNYGKSLSRSNRKEGKYPVYGSGGILGTHEKYFLKPPSIIVGRKGTVGSVFWVREPFFPIDTVYYITSESSFYFIHQNLKKQVFINSDAAVPGLNRDQAYLNPTIIPTKEVLNKYDKTVEPIYNQIGKLQQKNTLLKQSRDRLLPRLMSGKLEV